MTEGKKLQEMSLGELVDKMIAISIERFCRRHEMADAYQGYTSLFKFISSLPVNDDYINRIRDELEPFLREGASVGINREYNSAITPLIDELNRREQLYSKK